VIDAALGLLVLLLGAALAALALRALGRRRSRRRDGILLAVDSSADRPRTLVAEPYRLAGRPDALRQLPDGRQVPVEIKRRATPTMGPPFSHRIQVLAYCLLVESTTGRSPPYGVIRYGDGGEFRIRWDVAARNEVLALRRAVGGRYDGRATPSVARCARCPWNAICDVRAG
jgi:CRISPR-associated exonuclease Cas4